MKPFSDGLRLRRWRCLWLRLVAIAMMGAMLCSAAAEGAQLSVPTATLSATPAPADAASASAVDDPGVHLYAIVSDMRGDKKTVLRNYRLYYEMVLMSVAIELKESGALQGLSLCAAQAQEDGFQEITGDPDAMALQLYRAMEGMKRAGDELSINTWAAIEKALDQSAEEGTRPVIMLLYGDDIHRITPGRSISSKVNDSGVKLFYLEGKRDIFFDGFRRTLGLRPKMLTAPTEAPAEDASASTAETAAFIEDEPASEVAEMFYARCGKANARDSETLQKLVAAIVREVLGRERNVSPFQLVSKPAACLSIEPQNGGNTVYSFSYKDLDPNIDVMLINLRGVERVQERSSSVLVDASASNSTVFAVNLHPELQAVEGLAVLDDAAPEEAAQGDAANQTPDGVSPTPSATAGDAGQMPVALDEPVDGADAESEPQEGEAESEDEAEDALVVPTVSPDESGDPDYIATVRGRKIRGKGILVHESQVIRAQLDAQKVLEALQSARLIWPETGYSELKVDFSGVDAAQLQLLDGRDYLASVHVFHGEQEISAANFNSSAASKPLAFKIEKSGTYHVKMVVEHARTQVEGDVGEPFGKDNQKPQIIGDEEISLGTFVVAGEGEVLDTLKLDRYFSDADVGTKLSYYVDVAPLEGSELTIRAGKEFGAASCIVQASDLVDFSNMLTITWITRSAQELLASADFELSVTPEEIYKGTQGEISAAATLVEADAIRNLDRLEAAWAETELTVKFVGTQEGSAELPDLTLAPEGRGADGRWLWKGSFTAPAERAGDYAIELYCGEQRLNEGAADALHMVNRAPQQKQGAQLKIDEKQKDFQQATKELKLADFIDAEPNDVLRIDISSTRSQFKLNEETDTLEQQEEGGGGESGTMTWDVAEEPDRSLTVSISHFNQPNRVKGSLILDIEDQEGETSKVEIPYNVGNSQRDASVLPIIALALAGLVALFIALGAVYLVQKKRGPRF